MAQLADDVHLTAVQQVADSLAVQLARLLQHFAVGSVREPQATVLAALRAD